jgi:hypothetical protein
MKLLSWLFTSPVIPPLCYHPKQGTRGRWLRNNKQTQWPLQAKQSLSAVWWDNMLRALSRLQCVALSPLWIDSNKGSAITCKEMCGCSIFITAINHARRASNKYWLPDFKLLLSLDVWPLSKSTVISHSTETCLTICVFPSLLNQQIDRNSAHKGLKCISIWKYVAERTLAHFTVITVQPQPDWYY